MKVFKRIRTLFLLGFALLLLNISADAKAETLPVVDLNPNTDPTWTVYVDSNNYVCIETYDQKKTTSISYGTRGFTISRCMLNEQRLHNGADSQYVGMGLFTNYRTSDEVILSGNGKIYEHNIFRIPMDKIKQAVHNAGYTEWEQEITNYYYNHDEENICFLKFDCMMVTIRNGIDEGYIYYESNGTMSAGGKVYTNIPSDMNKAIEQQCPFAIQHAYSWKNADRLVYRFNRYLPEGGGLIGNTEVSDLPEPVAIYETKNTSNGFDLSKAIPSSESVTNTISASTFTGDEFQYATQSVKQTGIQSRQYNYELKVVTYEDRPKVVQTGSTTSWTLVFIVDAVSTPDMYKEAYEATKTGRYRLRSTI